jgi:hypothetical protein
METKCELLAKGCDCGPTEMRKCFTESQLGKKVISRTKAFVMIAWLAVLMMVLSAGFVILVVTLVKWFGCA